MIQNTANFYSTGNTSATNSDFAATKGARSKIRDIETVVVVVVVLIFV